MPRGTSICGAAAFPARGSSFQATTVLLLLQLLICFTASAAAISSAPPAAALTDHHHHATASSSSQWPHSKYPVSDRLMQSELSSTGPTQATTAAATAGTAVPSGAVAAQSAMDPSAPAHLQLQEQQQELQQSQQRRRLQEHQQLTPAQKAVAQWYARQQQQLSAAGGLPAPLQPPPPPPPPAVPGTPAALAPATLAGDKQQQQQEQQQEAAAVEFTIPVPPPGTNVPAEVLMPLYSPDQLRLLHKPIPGVPLSSQMISLAEQMQQAEALKVTLTQEQLENANPLLGAKGPVTVPQKSSLGDFDEYGYVAICAIVKNQHSDIREWLEYHRWLGVGKVYVYDNNSTTPLAGTIADLMQSGFVEYSFFTGMSRYRDLFRTSSQWWAYNDCVHRFRHRHRWMAFIDADEFIVLTEPQYSAEHRPSWQVQQQQKAQQFATKAQSQGDAHAAAGAAGDEVTLTPAAAAAAAAQTHDINTFMQQYEQYGGLAVNWVIFGSSGHTSRPRGGVLVNYHACLPDQQEQNTHVKVIANTQHLMTVGDDPHRVYYYYYTSSSSSQFTVDELGHKVEYARTGAPSHTKIALHHYLTKSEQEYMAKMRRGSAAGNYKSPEFFLTINQYATATCTRGIALGLKCCPSVVDELGPRGVQEVRHKLAELQQQEQEQQGSAGQQ